MRKMPSLSETIWSYKVGGPLLFWHLQRWVTTLKHQVYYALFDITKSLRLKNEKWMPTFQRSEFLTASFWWSLQEVMNTSDSNTEYTYKEPEVQTTSSWSPAPLNLMVHAGW